MGRPHPPRSTRRVFSVTLGALLLAAGAVGAAPTLPQVMEWALGTTRRPPQGTDPKIRRLHLRPSAAQADEDSGVRASSLLPDPRQAGSWLVVRDGRLFQWRWGEEPRPLQTSAPPVAQLLASRGSGDGALVYAATATTPAALWEIRLGTPPAARPFTPPAAAAPWQDREAFLREHRVSRCQAGGLRCLITTAALGRGALRIEGEPGPPRQLGALRVEAAAWEDQGRVLVVASEAP